MTEDKKVSNGMKIGIDARLWSQGGVGRYIRNLCFNLAQIDKNNSYVLFVTKQDDQSVKDIIKNKNWKITIANVKWHSLREQLFLRRIIEKEKVDLMHFPYFNVPVFYNKPFVITIHDLIYHHFVSGQASTHPLWLLGFKILSYRFVIRNAANRSKKIIAVSNFTKNDIANTLKVDKQKIEVIYEAADDVRNLKTQEIGIKNYFLYVGNVYPHKNMGLLLEAFKVLSQKNPNLHLVFVGKEDFLYKELKKHVKKLSSGGKIVFFDEVNDDKLVSLYRSAICLVRPSLMEGFSLPPLEAMENKCLVLASDIPVHREIFGESIIYFDQYSLDDILAKMNYVLNLPKSEKEHLIKKQIEKAKEFSWNKTARETLRVYDNLSNSANKS